MLNENIKKDRALDMSKKFNSIAVKIVDMAYIDLVNLLYKTNIPYRHKVVTKMIKDNKLKLERRGYYSHTELPIHWSYFYELLDYLGKYNNGTSTSLPIKVHVSTSDNSQLKSESIVAKSRKNGKKYLIERMDTQPFEVLKELIKKDVSDDTILSIFPDLKIN